MKAKKSSNLLTVEQNSVNRDAYGFTVRPQHLHRYREYANIYKEEEEERAERWRDFLERQAESAQHTINGLSKKVSKKRSQIKADLLEAVTGSEKVSEENDSGNGRSSISDGLSNGVLEKEEIPEAKEIKNHKVQIWSQIRSSLTTIEYMMSFRVNKEKHVGVDEKVTVSGNHLSLVEEATLVNGASDEESEDEFYDVEKSDSNTVQDVPSSEHVPAPSNVLFPEPFLSWKQELECLVRGGVPMALRGELWQAFVGVSACRVEKYYQDLLYPETNTGDKQHRDPSFSNHISKAPSLNHELPPEKWKGQIEKDLPRTFPGHPALDEDGRNALRRLLTAYARHNPSVGYCQAMNFFAGLLLLLMPEENAFWTLAGIMDNYFDGYYSEEMLESQVDQLVFEELMRERFPKLVMHLDYLGVQVAWVTGPWFLSIFVNILPWESVLRVWDVLLFEGNRVMLFRTACALMELYGPALVTTKDAGDAVTLLQSLAGSTFDSSQLVLTACMGFQTVTETRLRELRDKHRPLVRVAIEERSKGLHAWRDKQGLASKLYNFKQDTASTMTETSPIGVCDMQAHGDATLLESGCDGINFFSGAKGDADIDSMSDLKEQATWLKVEFCRLLEEKRSAIIRAEELEAALMEMVKQDNRHQLSARVQMLEQELAELQEALAKKQEQENCMLQVLMRVEQEQKVTEDARRLAEQDVAAQKAAAQVLQGKYVDTLALLAQMEKRLIIAESTLEATLQYQSGQVKALQSPRENHTLLRI